MAEQPIKYSEIVDIKDVEQGIQRMGKLFEKMLADVRKQAGVLLGEVGGTSPSTPKGQAALKKQAKTIDQFVAKEKELIITQNKLAVARKRVTEANRQNIKQRERNLEVSRKFKQNIKEEVKLEGSAKDSLIRLKKELKDLTAQYNKVSAAQRKEMAPNLKKVRGEIEKQEKATGQATRGVGKYREGFLKAGKQLLAFTGLAGGATAVVSKLTRVFKQSIDDFASFETGQKNVQSLLDEFDATLERRTIDLMKSYGLSIEDTNKALFDAVSAGIPAAEATEFLGTAAKLAIAGVTDLTTATDGITTIMNAYRLETSEAANIADAFFSAQKFGKTTVDQLASSIGRVAPIAKAAGVSYQELLSTFALLTKAGISTEETGTAIRATIQALIKPTEDAEKAMALYGIETGVAAIKNNGLFETLTKVALVTSVNEDALTEFIPNVRALVGVASLSAEALADYDVILNTVQTDTGDTSSATKAFEDQMTSFNKQNDQVVAGLKEHTTELGENLAPVLITAKKGLLGYIDVEKKVLTLFGAIISGNLFGKRREEIEATNKLIEEQKAATTELSAEELTALADKIEADRKATIEQVRNVERIKELEAQQAARTKATLASQLKHSLEQRKVFLKQGEEAAKTIRVTGTEETNTIVLEATKELYTAEEELARAHAEALIAIDKEISVDKRKRIADDAAKALELAESGTQSLIDIFEAGKQRELSAAGDNAKLREEIEQKFFKKQQALNIALAVIEGAKGVVKAVAFSPETFGLPWSAFVAATTVANIATISAQKFAEGGYEVLGGKRHSEGGTMTAMGEAEKGEGMAIFSRRATSAYSDILPDIVESINNRKFHEIFGRSHQMINVITKTDPFTEKMYQLMSNTPVIYIDTDGKTVKQYPNGYKEVINRV